jgi:hypothetical protein
MTQRALPLLSLLLAAVILAGCGILDLDGANARAAAQAEANAEYEQTKQAVILSGIENSRLAAEVEKARAYYAYLATTGARDGQDAGRAGTDHNGGVTASVGLELGAGIGWPTILLLLLAACAVGAAILWARGQAR